MQLAAAVQQDATAAAVERLHSAAREAAQAASPAKRVRQHSIACFCDGAESSNADASRELPSS